MTLICLLKEMDEHYQKDGIPLEQYRQVEEELEVLKEQYRKKTSGYEKLDETYQRLKNNHGELKQSFKDLKTEKSDLVKENKKLGREKEELADRFARLEDDYEAEQDKSAELKREVNRLDRDYSRMRDERDEHKNPDTVHTGRLLGTYNLVHVSTPRQVLKKDVPVTSGHVLHFMLGDEDYILKFYGYITSSSIKIGAGILRDPDKNRPKGRFASMYMQGSNYVNEYQIFVKEERPFIVEIDSISNIVFADGIKVAIKPYEPIGFKWEMVENKIVKKKWPVSLIGGDFKQVGIPIIRDSAYVPIELYEIDAPVTNIVLGLYESKGGLYMPKKQK